MANPTKSTQMRHSSRLAAVQYLYQWKLEAKMPDMARFIEATNERQLEPKEESPDEHMLAPKASADMAFLRKLLTGYAQENETVRLYLESQMEEGRAHDRTSPLIQSLLEAGAYELIHHDNIKTNIILSEYTAIAARFFDNPELGFVNGVLQEAAKLIRDANAKEGSIPEKAPSEEADKKPKFTVEIRESTAEKD